VKVVVDIVAGARAGQRLTLDSARPIRFGRAPDNDVAFDPDRDRDASGRHAELRMDRGQLWLYDLGSANGTRLQGEAITRAPVPPGAEIEFGAGGPRVTIGYEGGRVLIPPTITPDLPLASGSREAPRLAPLASSIANPRAHRGSLATAPTLEQKIGQRTVAMMIDQALARARREPARLRLLALALAALLIVTVGGVVTAYRLRAPSADGLRRQMVQVMELERAASDAERAMLQRRLDQLSAELARAGGRGGAEVARANHDAVFLVAVRSPTRQPGTQEEGFCTAFAVAADRLVTNAHCIAAADDLRRRGGQIFVVQNGHAETRLPVSRMRRVRGFVPGGSAITPDVGWLQVDAKLATVAQLAPPAEYEALATGDPMFTYGFPGRLADASAPEATFVEGVIGRVTTLDGRAGELKERRLIQHSAFTAGGTSGSPIFNAAGHVVAVNTGGYVDKSAALAGYNFGMRIDLVGELLSEADE
jgi:S1-C subfamily serine protease